MEDNKIVKIDYSNIYEYMEDRAPYLFVDKAEVSVGKSAKGTKLFTRNERFFDVHFPNDPIVPAVYQLEMITQLAGLIVQTQKDELGSTKLYIKRYSDVEIFEAIRPGTEVFITAEILSFKRGFLKGKGEAYSISGDEKIKHCNAEFQMVMPEIIQRFLPNRDI